MICMETQTVWGEEEVDFIFLLPHYENVGSALGNESNNIQDICMNSSLESFHFLEEASEDCDSVIQ